MGKQLVVGLGAAIFLKNTMDAYNTGDMELTNKVAVIESKIAGGIIGGTVGNFGGKVVARGVIYIIGLVAGAAGYTISLPVSLTITAVVIGAGVIGGVNMVQIWLKMNSKKDRSMLMESQLIDFHGSILIGLLVIGLMLLLCIYNLLFIKKIVKNFLKKYMVLKNI